MPAGKMKLKKGDTVVVISGKDKGAQGEIIHVLPKSNQVIVTGVNIAKKHQKATRNTRQGGIIDKDMPMDASNVMLVHKGKPTRVGFDVRADGTKVRVAKSTGEVIS
jgi:large subunit ribosomal protein L24